MDAKITVLVWATGIDRDNGLKVRQDSTQARNIHKNVVRLMRHPTKPCTSSRVGTLQQGSSMLWQVEKELLNLIPILPTD